MISSLYKEVALKHRESPGLCPQRQDHEDAGGGVHLQIKDKGLSRDQPCEHLDHGLQNCEKINTDCLLHPIHDIL